MKSKTVARRRLTLLILCTFLSAGLSVTAARAQETALPAASYAGLAAASGVGREKVWVLDNALLDNVFVKERAAEKAQSTSHNEASVNQNTEKKPIPALLRPTDSFAAKITSRTPSMLAAALRFAEQGRKENKSQRYQRAINYFERAVSLGVRSYLPYIYYYLAHSHFHLANYQSAFNFLDVAESWLADDADWTTFLAALRPQSANRIDYAHSPSGSKLR